MVGNGVPHRSSQSSRAEGDVLSTGLPVAGSSPVGIVNLELRRQPRFTAAEPSNGLALPNDADKTGDPKQIAALARAEEAERKLKQALRRLRELEKPGANLACNSLLGEPEGRLFLSQNTLLARPDPLGGPGGAFAEGEFLSKMRRL